MALCSTQESGVFYILSIPMSVLLFFSKPTPICRKATASSQKSDLSVCEFWVDLGLTKTVKMVEIRRKGGGIPKYRKFFDPFFEIFHGFSRF